MAFAAGALLFGTVFHDLDGESLHQLKDGRVEIDDRVHFLERRLGDGDVAHIEAAQRRIHRHPFVGPIQASAHM